MAKEQDHSADDGTGFESCSSVSSVVISSSLDMMKALLSSSITVWKKVNKKLTLVALKLKQQCSMEFIHN